MGITLVANYFGGKNRSALHSSYIQFKNPLSYSISGFSEFGQGLALKIPEFAHRRKYQHLLIEGLEYLIVGDCHDIFKQNYYVPVQVGPLGA